MGTRPSPPAEPKPVSIYAAPADVDYADDVAQKLQRSRSWVYARALRALRRERHDVGTLLQPILFTLDELALGLVKPEEAAAKIRAQVGRVVGVMREDDK